MKQEEMKRKFKQWQKTHCNAMTPELVEVKIVDNYIIELSKAKSGDQRGVTLLKREDGEFRRVSNEIDKPFHDKEEAREYFNLIHQKLKSYDEIDSLIGDLQDAEDSNEQNKTCVLLHECDKDELEIGDSFKDSEGNLDKSQLFDDLELYRETGDDIDALRGMLAELEARVIHEP